MTFWNKVKVMSQVTGKNKSFKKLVDELHCQFGQLQQRQQQHKVSKLLK